MEWLNKLETPIPNGAITWLVIAILAVILLLLLLALYRRLTGGLFIAGGRSRKARLSVMDAAPVDSHRRLVLVRRDDVRGARDVARFVKKNMGLPHVPVERLELGLDPHAMQTVLETYIRQHLDELADVRPELG